MGRIDDALTILESLEDETHRALELAGLISTLFKIRGVVLVVTGQLAFDSYANTTRPDPELELAPLAGKLTPRMLQEIMGEQLRGEGSIRRWIVAGIRIEFHDDAAIALRELCRDFMTDHGVAKLIPAEEITAESILAAVYPVPNPVAHQEALLLLQNGLSEAFMMDWKALGNLCHQPEYRIGEELAMLRTEAKRQLDAQASEAEALAETAPAAEQAAPAAATETPVTPPVEITPTATPSSSALKSSRRIRLASLGSE